MNNRKTQEKKTHNKRVATALKDSVKNKQPVEENADEPHLMTHAEVEKEVEKEEKKEEKKTEEKAEPVQKISRNSQMIKDHLRKKLQQKTQKDEENKINAHSVQQLLKVEVKETIATKNQLDSNIKKLTELLEKSKQ